MCLDDYDFPLLARDDGGGEAQLRGAAQRSVGHSGSTQRDGGTRIRRAMELSGGGGGGDESSDGVE